MIIASKGCGRILVIPRDRIMIGRFTDLLIFDVPSHIAMSRVCPWSGRTHVDGYEQDPEGRKSTRIWSGTASRFWTSLEGGGTSTADISFIRPVHPRES
jgi:hypothetical protein